MGAARPFTAEREEKKLKPFDFKKEEVKIASRTGANPLSLKKDAEGNWEITSPVLDKADRYGVEGLLERIAEAQAIRWVDRTLRLRSWAWSLPGLFGNLRVTSWPSTSRWAGKPHSTRGYM